MTELSSSPDLKAIKERVDRTHAEMVRLTKPDEHWRMSIPARPDRDSDLIISETVRDVDHLLGEVARLRADLEAFKPQPMSQRCRDGHHNGVGGERCVNCWCLCHNQDAKVAELQATLNVRDGQLGRSRQFVAELQARVDDLTGQVAGRDETIQRIERSHRRLTARLRDLVADLRTRDEELLSARDRAKDHTRALGHERSAHEVRTVANRLDGILTSLDGGPADDGRPSDG